MWRVTEAPWHLGQGWDRVLRPSVLERGISWSAQFHLISDVWMQFFLFCSLLLRFDLKEKMPVREWSVGG